MGKPKFEFMANSASPDDRSGLAVWRYTERHRGEEVEVVTRISFGTFAAAHEINTLIDAAWRDGEAAGYAACQERVLQAMRGS